VPTAAIRYLVLSQLDRRTTGARRTFFASLAKLRDAINNDIEIVENADSVLVYDRPIGADGIRWRDLQTWWRGNTQPSK
jgi:hypothetical protein